MSQLILPHGCVLTECMVPPAEVREWRKKKNLKGLWALSVTQFSHLEMIMSGAFSPLSGFMNRADYEGVVTRMRLQDGTFWPVPIALDVHDAFAEKVEIGDPIGLTDSEGALVAILEISDLWRPEDERVGIDGFQMEGAFSAEGFRPTTNRHRNFIGGRVFGLEMPQHFDFHHYRLTPRKLREQMQQMAWSRVIAYQPKDQIHRAQLEFIQHEAKEADANVLLCPLVGGTSVDSIDHYDRLRGLIRVQQRQGMLLSMIPISPKIADSRDALLHAIVHRNYGCSHFIITQPRDGTSANVDALHATTAEIARHQDELGIKAIPFVESSDIDFPEVTTLHGIVARKNAIAEEIDGLRSENTINGAAMSLKNPSRKIGATIFFTGLSGAGKSTIAKALLARLMELSGRQVTLLDGDIVRQHLSSELGFSRAHRDLNILRIGFVASEITKHGGIAICAPIAPYAQTREQVRKMIEQYGDFIEVYVSTSLDVCEARDRKGLYAKARAGVIKEFTGVTDPYEVPESPELEIDSTGCTPHEAVARILSMLELRSVFEKHELPSDQHSVAGTVLPSTQSNSFPHG